LVCNQTVTEWQSNHVAVTPLTAHIRANSITSICCGFDVQQMPNLLWICCTTNPHSAVTRRTDTLPCLLCWSQVRRHVKMLWICCTTFYVLWMCVQQIQNKLN